MGNDDDPSAFGLSLVVGNVSLIDDAKDEATPSEGEEIADFNALLTAGFSVGLRDIDSRHRNIKCHV
jgi:hypothetical protein